MLFLINFVSMSVTQSFSKNHEAVSGSLNKDCNADNNGCPNKYIIRLKTIKRNKVRIFLTPRTIRLKKKKRRKSKQNGCAFLGKAMWDPVYPFLYTHRKHFIIQYIASPVTLKKLK